MTIPFCPESPRYLLLQKKDKTEALKALIWLRGTGDVQEELTTIQLEGEIMANESSKVSLIGIFRDPFLRKVMVICLSIILAQQFSGIGPLTAYTNQIFLTAGLDKMAALYGTIGLFSLQVVSVSNEY